MGGGSIPPVPTMGMRQNGEIDMGSLEVVVVEHFKSVLENKLSTNTLDIF